MDWKRLRPWILPTPANIQVAPLNLQAGLKHYSKQRDGAYVRYHLRIEHSGQSLLIAAASEAVRLTQSGTIAAFGLLENKSNSEIVAALHDHPQAQEMIDKVQAIIDNLGRANKRYPIFNLTDPSASENPLGLIAPFQADLELPTDATRIPKILQSLWQAGIPHVRFVGLEEVYLRDNSRLSSLYRAVEFAEDIGMIAGVRLEASSLMQSTESSAAVVDRLAELGLDYVVTPWGVTRELHATLFGSHDYQALEPLARRAERWEFPVVLEAGLLHETVQHLESQLDQAIQNGYNYFELYSITLRPNQSFECNSANAKLTPYQAQHMPQLASWVEDLADNRRAQLVWLAPHTLSGNSDSQRIAQLLKRGPRAGADVSIRIDGQGNVYAPRGPKISVGVIDRDAWSTIWNHDCFRSFREMVSRNDHCNLCPMLTTCAVHCPADPVGWALEE